MITILRADARSIPLANESVDCVVTSPPYWGLRDYGVEGQLGLERLHDCLGWARGSECDECHVCAMRRVFREVHRVLKPTGTLWLNYGDCYASAWACNRRSKVGNGSPSLAERMPRIRRGLDCDPKRGVAAEGQPKKAHSSPGLKPKDLVGMAWRIAFALQADGWWLRNDIIWSKPNPMPESCRDRATKSHEYLFLLSKAGAYHFDQGAWKEPSSPGTHERHGKTSAYAVYHTPRSRKPHKFPANWAAGPGSHDVLEHNKPMPRDAGREQQGLRIAESFGRGPCFRKRAAEGSGIKNNDSMDAALAIMPAFRNRRTVWELNSDRTSEAHFATFPEALVEPCILAGCPKDGVVFDPFCGSGTTLVVANRLGRSGVGLELNPEYIEIARRRVFADVTPTREEKASGQKLLLEAL